MASNKALIQDSDEPGLMMFLKSENIRSIMHLWFSISLNRFGVGVMKNGRAKVKDSYGTNEIR